ncbi:MAG: hypothetical protein WCF20_00830 [Methylovirgula sp.]
MSEGNVSPTSNDGRPVSADYNTIFEKLVGDPEEENLEGYISYVYYKQTKREWVLKFQQKNGRKPNDKELQDYVETWTESSLSAYQKKAEQALIEFITYIIDNERPKILREALQHRSFVRDASVAFVGAFLYTVFLIAVTLALKFADIDLVTIMQKIFAH